MQKKVSFRNPQGEKLVGVLHQVRQQGQRPAAVICHGFKGDKDSLQLKTMASNFAAAGIVTLRFDFANKPGESDRPFEDLLFSQMLKDLKTAIDFLGKQKNVDKNRIGLAGHSLGGKLVMTYAATDKRIKVAADLAAPIDRAGGKTGVEKLAAGQGAVAKKRGYFIVFSKRLHKHYRLKYRYLADLLKHNTPAQIKKIKIPVIIIHGSKDETVPLGHSKLAYRLLKSPKAFHVIKGARHNWRGPKDLRYRK